VLIQEKAEGHKKSGVNYEQLGKAVEDALVLDYIYVLHSTKRQVWSSFVRGFFAGLGGIIGATLGVSLLLAILQLFGGAPLIGEFFKAISDSIEGK
jgi:hypothetical protein